MRKRSEGSNPSLSAIYSMNNYALCGGVAQLARAFGSYPKGRGFDPLRRYQVRDYIAVVVELADTPS